MSNSAATPSKTPALQRLRGAWDALRGHRSEIGESSHAGGERVYLAVLRIDQMDGFARRSGPKAAEDLTRAALACVGRHIAQARIARTTRGRIEFTFSSLDADGAKAAAIGLLEQIEALFAQDELASGLHAAVGLAALEPGCTMPEIGARAERALTSAEASAARCVAWARQDHGGASGRLALARDLRAALASGEVTVAYQPKLHLRGGVVDSAEALVRWRHPEHGAISPEVFVGLAEESGDIGRLTHYVLARAVADQADLARHGHVLAINVNLSGQLVADEAFCAEALAVCAQATGQMGLEITETSVFTDPERALRNLRRLADGGVSIAIDDYGSGLSSLSYLKQLPANELKIDRLFVSSLTSSHRDPLIVRSTIDLAHALEMEVTAEGVDQPAALALLKVMGCDRAQGFHIAAALPLGGLISFLDEMVNRDLTSEASDILNLGNHNLMKRYT